MGWPRRWKCRRGFFSCARGTSGSGWRLRAGDAMPPSSARCRRVFEAVAALREAADESKRRRERAFAPTVSASGIRHLAFGSRVFGGARPTVVYPAKPSRAGSPRCGPAFQSRRETAADAEAKRNRSVVSAPSGPHRHPSGMHVEPLGTRSTAETAPRLRSRRRFDRAGRASPRSPANASAEIRHARTAASAPHPAKNGKCPATKIRQSKGGPCARPRARGLRNGEPRGERCGVAQTRDERVRAQRRRASRHAAPATAARGALRRITPAAGGFRRRAETPVRRTCTDVSYLRKRLSQFVGCTGFFLATM